jgi:hypothetical protein
LARHGGIVLQRLGGVRFAHRHASAVGVRGIRCQVVVLRKFTVLI